MTRRWRCLLLPARKSSWNKTLSSASRLEGAGGVGGVNCAWWRSPRNAGALDVSVRWVTLSGGSVKRDKSSTEGCQVKKCDGVVLEGGGKPLVTSSVRTTSLLGTDLSHLSTSLPIDVIVPGNVNLPLFITPSFQQWDATLGGSSLCVWNCVSGRERESQTHHVFHFCCSSPRFSTDYQVWDATRANTFAVVVRGKVGNN